MSELWADMVAEKWTNEGPTGDFVEVLEAAVVDYGGNEYGHGTTSKEVSAIQAGLRIPTRIRVLRTGQSAAGGDFNCGICQ